MLEKVESPALLLVESKMRNNATAMLSRAKELKVAIRPHVKTHKTLQGALLQTGGERERIVVSTLAEADIFGIEYGFSDILYAVIVGVDKIQHIVKLHSMVDRFQNFWFILSSHLFYHQCWTWLGSC
eukprot:m.57529 g.57529  ORF g.57529 m.57529 type:complete len:127 (+) comp7830_c2_seq2:223-603(+)